MLTQLSSEDKNSLSITHQDVLVPHSPPLDKSDDSVRHPEGGWWGSETHCCPYPRVFATSRIFLLAPFRMSLWSCRFLRISAPWPKTSSIYLHRALSQSTSKLSTLTYWSSQDCSGAAWRDRSGWSSPSLWKLRWS